MTTAEQAAQMRDNGISIEEIMLKFGWKRASAFSFVSRGRKIEQYRQAANQQSRRRRSTVCKRPSSLAENRVAIAARNRLIIAMVMAGATYAEAGRAQRVSKGVVAGVCYRYSVKQSIAAPHLSAGSNL